jgi:hypothetical protein
VIMYPGQIMVVTYLYVCFYMCLYRPGLYICF